MIDKAIGWLTGTPAPMHRWEHIIVSAITQAPILALAYYLGHRGWPL